MNRYRQKKEQVRDFAAEWQEEFSENRYTWADVAAYADMFSRLGRRWGLLREFRENGLC